MTGPSPFPRQDPPRRSHLARASVCSTLLLIASAAQGADSGTAAGDPGTVALPAAGASTGGDDLAIFNDLPVVVSASRQPTAITLSSAPVSVLSAEDIHAGGHTSLAEALQFTLGIDVERNDRNVYSVGVRGLHGIFSDRTLTLINGRNADSPIYGGAEFARLPLLLGDIDHVEVVRGPGGSAWGANAFNGVINIITKDPEDMLGAFASTNVSAFGDSASEVRWAETAGRWSWRTSLGFLDHASSANALGNDGLPDTDWRKTGITDNEVVYRLDETTRVRGGLGYELDRGGAIAFVGYQPTDESYHRTARAYARVDHRFDQDTSYQLEWYGNFSQAYEPAVGIYRSNEHVIDGQFDFTASHGHHLSLGGAASVIDATTLTTGDPNQFTFVGSPYHEQRDGGYLTDRWQALERLAIEGQIRADRYTGTGNDWAGRLSALWSLDRGQRQVLRISAVKSYRTPLAALRDAEVDHAVDGNPLVRFALVPGDDLRNEECWSGELGYSDQISDELLLRWDNYYQRYEHLVGYRFTPPDIFGPPPYVTTAQPANIAGATGYGSELELGWTTTKGRISAWYAYHGLETDELDQDLRAFRPPRHSVGATSRVELPARFAVTVNYRYTSPTIDPNPGNDSHVDLYHHLDITLSWRFDHGRGELMGGVLDLLETTEAPVLASGIESAHVTPGRTFFVRAEWGF